LFNTTTFFNDVREVIWRLPMEFKLCPNDGNKVTIRECEQREGTT
jgi:hypothetical protein